jgi:hypothetical protein
MAVELPAREARLPSVRTIVATSGTGSAGKPRQAITKLKYKYTSSKHCKIGTLHLNNPY